MIRSGAVHGLIGPNGSGKTTTLNVVSGYYRPQAGRMMLGDRELEAGAPVGPGSSGNCPDIPDAAYRWGILRTCEDNVLIGATIRGTASFLGNPAVAWPASPRRGGVPDRGTSCPEGGRAGSAGRCPRRPFLQHSELRFLEIARALVLRPGSCCSTSPPPACHRMKSAGLASLIAEIRRRGSAWLLVKVGIMRT